MGIVITLLVLGAALLVVEVLLPGMIAGVLGFGCLVVAVVLGYSEFGTLGGNLLLALVAFGLLIGTLVWFKYFPESRFGRKFVSERVIGNIDAERPELLHRTGTAHTALRPSGTAEIEGERVDVVTEGGLIEAGTPIKVIEVEGMRVVVRAVDPVSETTE